MSYFKGVSLPFPEPGIRLIRQDDIQTFDVQLTTLKADLAEAVEKLNDHYADIQASEDVGEQGDRSRQIRRFVDGGQRRSPTPQPLETEQKT